MIRFIYTLDKPMHFKIYSTFYLIFVFILSSLQPLSAQHFDKFHKGIHQIELERHYNDEVVLPPFNQAPISLKKRKSDFGPAREIFGYHPYWMGEAYKSYHFDLLSTIAYFGIEVNGQGSVVNRRGWPANELVQLAHQNGVKVVIVCILFDAGQLTTLLSNETNRTRLINNLLSEAKRGNADGVNIDFERVPGSQRNNLTIFMGALADTLRNHITNAQISMATPAVDWQNAFDFNRLNQICDLLFIMGYNYYWSGSSTAGPVSPLTGGNYNITKTVNDYLTKTGGDPSKIVLGIPYYGIEWPVSGMEARSSTSGKGRAIFNYSAESKARYFGKIRDNISATPWYRFLESGNWRQGWFDDSLSLGKKYDFAISKNLKGVGMWALGYDGSRIELWQALAAGFGASVPPLPPSHFRVLALSDGKVHVSFKPVPDARAYRLYRSPDGNVYNFLIEFNDPEITVANLPVNQIQFLRATALNDFGESASTEVLGCVPAAEKSQALIVNGFDRESIGGNTNNFIVQHGNSIWHSGVSFSSAANECIEDSSVVLTDFTIVDWILGLESTYDETFNFQEQKEVKAFLENGGRFFVSGSEIGWDLEYKGNQEDLNFYRNYLKAKFVIDKVNDYSVSGSINSAMAGLAFNYNNSSLYPVKYPDGITSFAGSIPTVRYNGSYVAGIEYQGTFGNGTTAGKLIYFGFPFETIYPGVKRDSVMARVLKFFNAGTTTGVYDKTASLPTSFKLWPAYPNPFNSSTVIQFYTKSKKAVSLKIYDLLGREIRSLWAAGDSDQTSLIKVTWNGLDDSFTAVASGVYVVKLVTDSNIATQKIILIR